MSQDPERRRAQAREVLLAAGGAGLGVAPWQHPKEAPADGVLLRFALWRVTGQGDDVSVPELEAGLSLIDSARSEPVSYTHLDVYKRQLLESVRPDRELHGDEDHPDISRDARPGVQRAAGARAARRARRRPGRVGSIPVCRRSRRRCSRSS